MIEYLTFPFGDSLCKLDLSCWVRNISLLEGTDTNDTTNPGITIFTAIDIPSVKIEISLKSIVNYYLCNKPEEESIKCSEYLLSFSCALISCCLECKHPYKYVPALDTNLFPGHKHSIPFWITSRLLI